MRDKPYERLVRFTESFFERHGDCYLGVGWTKRQEDADTRYRVMLDLIAGDDDRPVTLLDFGCGASHLYEYLRARPQEQHQPTAASTCRPGSSPARAANFPT